MIEAIGGVLKSVREAGPRIYFACAASGALLLFSPAQLIATLGLDTFVAQYRPLIGAVLVISAMLLTTELVIWASSSFVAWRKRRTSHERRMKLLDVLTIDERTYLAPYIINGENTCYFAMDDGISGGLESKGFLYVSANVGSLVDGVAYNLQQWAREALTLRQDLFVDIKQLPQSPRDRLMSRW